jgi:sugar phosphate isomerase/epimerase
MADTPLPLSAFADEISPELDQQVAVCRRAGVSHFELRSVGGVNVLDLSEATRQQVRSTLADAGLGVACIGSPVGKVPIDQPWAEHLDRFKVAIDAARFFAAPMIRIFSYYGPTGGSVLDHRDEVVRRLAAQAELAAAAGVTLVHENERHIYGERGDACLDLLRSVNSPRLRAAFDFANFVQAGDDPLACWGMLAPFTVHIHIKDALPDGRVVPPGTGAGQLGPIIRSAYDGGYRGFLSLEPHLAAAGQFSGFSGPDLFLTAATALRELCREHGIPLTAAS